MSSATALCQFTSFKPKTKKDIIPAGGCDKYRYDLFPHKG